SLLAWRRGARIASTDADFTEEAQLKRGRKDSLSGTHILSSMRCQLHAPSRTTRRASTPEQSVAHHRCSNANIIERSRRGMWCQRLATGSDTPGSPEKPRRNGYYSLDTMRAITA